MVDGDVFKSGMAEFQYTKVVQNELLDSGKRLYILTHRNLFCGNSSVGRAQPCQG